MTEAPLADANDMFAVHTMFRREFGLMPDLVRSTADGDTARTAVVADHVAFVAEVLHLHHTGEDEYIWPLLRERGAAGTTALVDVMEDQHDGVYKEDLRLSDLLKSWRETAAADDRDAVAASVERLLSQLSTHLALEEEKVVPMIERYVTMAEYGRMGEEGAARTPPDMLPVSLGMVLYEAEPAAVEMILAAMPAEVRPAFPKTATDAYAAYAERLYGTPTPPRITDGN
jgi:hemerythrin-like domain-containing protein